jgi:trehalose 6-phosphate synthase
MTESVSLSDGRLIVVANRTPPIAPADVAPAAGGLTNALLPALKALPGSLWFGWSGRAAKRGERPSIATRRFGSLRVVATDLPAEDVESYYNGFCNRSLWPLLHSFPDRFRAEAREYARYRGVNKLFAQAIARQLRPDDRVWVHDFHLIPLATELRTLGFGGAVGFFLHVPFPPHDVFSILPWADEILTDLLAYDLVGFHTGSYLENYERALERELSEAPDHETGVYPIGIDPVVHATWAQEPLGKRRGKELRDAVRGRALVLAVDRLDYTKGVVQRLRMLERFFEDHADWRGRISVLQISAPTRTRVQEYAQQRREVEELVGHINGRFGEPDWVPVRYVFRTFSQRDLTAFYREADVCLVTPLRDGMNLVAKEFIAAQTGDPGVLVLSRFAGAAESLREALIVNPYDLEGTARALARALTMPVAERAARQAALRERIGEWTAARWRERFLEDLREARRKRAAAGPFVRVRGGPLVRT